MCGIAGLFGTGATAEKAVAMRDSIAHRGPDGAGLFTADGVALGHRRLSIIDLSDNGAQPMTTPDGRYTIVYNGEVYNYLELRREVGSAAPWKSESDTEVILNAFAKWGTSAIERLNGMFAFAIYDREKRTLTCVRDRMGIKPFYYYFDGTNFFFASEIKALLAAGVRRAPNETRIADYLAYGMYDHTDETFFEDIQKLPPGHYVELRAGQAPRPVRYWNLPERAASLDIPKTEEEIARHFEELLTDAITLRLRSDVPVGVNLSSGLDSTTLLEVLRRVHPDMTKLHAFTVRFSDRRFDEGQYVEPLVREYHTPWHTPVLSLDDVEAISAKTLAAQDEPYGGIPQLAFYKLNQAEREAGVTVLLEGHGVEEYLTGYPLYFPPYWTDLLRGGHPLALARELHAYTVRGRGSFKNAIGAWWNYSTQRKAMHLDLTKQASASVMPDAYRRAHQHPLVSPTPFATHLENALYRNLTQTKLPRVLRFQDRVSMAHGRELRLPFLDYRLVEFLFALSGRYKIRDGEDKYLLRQSVRKTVKPEILNRPKSYVVTPQTEWLHGPLREKINATISSSSFRSRPCFNAEAARRRMDVFFADPHPKNSFPIWQLLNLEEWFRAYID